MPSAITSYRNHVFLNNIWNELFNLQGVALTKSTAYHPQTDGQIEVINKCLETYCCCMCSDKPSSWFIRISLAEWWYNTNFLTSIQSTPYEVVCKQAPLFTCSISLANQLILPWIESYLHANKCSNCSNFTS